LAKLGISQVCSPNIVRIIKEVCFVENHAKLSEYRGINILAFLILIQGTGGTKIGKGKYSN
jgi:hypothetical protein